MMAGVSLHGVTVAIRTVKDLGDAAAMAGILASTLFRKVEPMLAPSETIGECEPRRVPSEP